jgi:enoyl-CoA hydratase/carnithine racemase
VEFCGVRVVRFHLISLLIFIKERRAMKYQTILYKKEEGVGWITLNRPEVLNAINMKMFEEIQEALAKVEMDREVRVLVLTGKGSKAFCVGADLKEVREISGDPVREHAFYEAGPRMFAALANFPKPIIGAINGVSIAGGFEFILYCDIVIASEDARIGDAHANYVGIGPFACTIGPRKMAFRKAVELCLTGDIWPASECEKAGLVNYVVPADKLEEKVREIAAKLTDKMPLGSRAIKSVIRQTLEGDLNTTLKLAFKEAEVLAHTKDFKEGMKAFAEKRKPAYTGE